MSTAVDITINDGAASPVAHTLYPVQNSDGKGFTFFDQVAGNPVFEIKVWGKLKMGSTKVASESSVGVIQPVTHVVDGIVQQNHVNTSRVEFVYAPNATAAERADLYALTINALQHALIQEQARDLKAWY